MFEHRRERDERVVSRVARDDAEAVKQTLLQNVGLGTVPVIRIVDADHGHNRVLLLKHEHDGRDLDIGYLEKTLSYVLQLWGQPVLLQTLMQGEPATYSRNEARFERVKD